MRQIRFYLGRVNKRGIISNDGVVDAILNPPIIEKSEYHYTFSDTSAHRVEGTDFIFGKLSKYKPKGDVDTLNPEFKREEKIDIDNTIEASALFIYIPEFSGIAYPHLWNKLHKEYFEKLFAELVIKKHDNFFADCFIKPITDFRTFIYRVSKLSSINSMKTRIYPPNPLFGPAWESLKDYLKKRKLKEASFSEQGKDNDGIQSKLPALAMQITRDETVPKEALMEVVGEITDAAVLMALDGYGSAKIEGNEDGKGVIIKTSQNQMTFVAPTDCDPVELFRKAKEELSKINDERYLGH